MEIKEFGNMIEHFHNFNSVVQVLIATLFTWLMTALGAE
jgi:hypothetical protein